MFNRSCHYQNSTSEPFILAVFLQNKHFQRASLPRINSKLSLFSKDQRKNEPFHKKKYQKQCHRIDFLVNARSYTAATGGVFYQNSTTDILILVPGPFQHITAHPGQSLHISTIHKKTALRGQCIALRCDRMTAPQCSLYHYLFKVLYFLTFARTSFISCITGMFRNASPYTVSSCGRPSD